MPRLRIIPRTLAAGLAIGTVHAQETAPVQVVSPPVAMPANPENVKPDSSYALGYRMGGMFLQEFGRFGVVMDDIDSADFLKGFTAAARGEDPGIDEEKLQAAMQALGDMLQKREKQTAADNLKAGNEFLAENAKREGVVTTASGLQYEIIEKGGDEKYVPPKEGEPDDKQFLVNYKGTLIDGTEFDASAPGEPMPMTLQVVDGFKEALTMMPVGAKWKIYLPAELAYGEQRRSPEIGPNSALVFEIELVKIQSAPAPQGLPFPMPQPGAGQ
ncbi:MAG TPA: FKBP-type peptidyl-prolyl cis-trans isomerase [Luteolibacter sp.]|nr:FKBP-type peptidyl-prolyl cis-trans isomerase [Luteolibacter sp.]